ncbi:NBR1-Ig-like domain-containing protein [Planomonospora sp. ID82291]|uniref:NBR1-Ig-like domain-containing protein n=1 Tax=Planomonospora sp. ID82291 TaxID=2738136 RepID=UPI0018C4165B|nr:NBR1-Ig-like domain-containing protein [Planomonospora sp. ID82291]MBG0816951.1 transcriptional regulator [Planomonospora sp. ID82291]
MALLAHRLWELKERAGDPSFAEMSSSLGAAASKSSLAAAARGRTLPSWETTWEFVRVLAIGRLGQDERETEREWRAYWEQARTESLPASSAMEGGPVGNGPAGNGPVGNGPVGNGPVGNGPVGKRSVPAARSFRIGKPAVLSVLSAVLAGGTGAMVILFSPLDGDDTGEGGAPPEPSAWTAVLRDDSLFEGDVTYPDGTEVRRGERFTKVWRIRNAGAVPWQGRYLTRINTAPCRAPERVEIEPTAPGEVVDIAVRVRAADRPARCKIFWKMTSADGTPLFAGKKPIFLDVSVK